MQNAGNHITQTTKLQQQETLHSVHHIADSHLALEFSVQHFKEKLIIFFALHCVHRPTVHIMPQVTFLIRRRYEQPYNTPIVNLLTKNSLTISTCKHKYTTKKTKNEMNGKLQYLGNDFFAIKTTIE